uniref:Spaetzle domain-containing protein n=1 Tax=Anopheles minimus TaxID=112268 RepID=A0A182W586_9DIPT
MAHHQTSRALLILFTFQLYIVSLHANPQTFGPLIRDRAIRDRQQTSEEDLNANIDRIFQKEPKTTASPKDQNTDEVEPSPTELVSRSHAGGTLRPRQPLDKNEQNAMVYVIRDADGKLVPKFSSPQTIATTPEPNPPPSPEGTGSLVLKIAPESNNMDTPIFETGSYPKDYPHDAIARILEKNEGIYKDLFEVDIKREPLATRTNSEADMFLCSTVSKTIYPTASEVDGRYIVNVRGFYQPITIETCNVTNSTCTKSSTSSKYELRCIQTYRYYKLLALPVSESATNGSNRSDPVKFETIDYRYPACCKCAQVPKTSNPWN